MIGVSLDTSFPGPGARVSEVTPGSGADEAGLLDGDVITAIDGDVIAESTELIVSIRSNAPGDSVELTILRDGRTQDDGDGLPPKGSQRLLRGSGAGLDSSTSPGAVACWCRRSRQSATPGRLAPRRHDSWTGAINMARNRVAQGFRRIISGDRKGLEWVRQLVDGVDPGYRAWPRGMDGARSLPTLVGGVRALLMQALHPGALAGVVQHSRYEEDPLGRLAGTAQWLTVVTFGDTAMADRECARVRGMHRKVRGMYPVGGELRKYSAGDPELLRWVHVAFTDSFLATHRVWGGPIPGGEDAYVREWAKAGELVGVDNPPRSVAELQEQIRGFGPDLRGDQAAWDTVNFIRSAPVPLPAKGPYSVLFAGAAATISESHRRLLKLPRVPMTAVKPCLGPARWMSLVLGPTSPSMRNAADRIERLDEVQPA